MKTISILGCGWLGLPLAVSFIGEGYTVKGSTTHKEKAKRLSQKGIDSFLIALTQNNIEGDIGAFLNNSKTLIVNIPPGMRKNPSESFAQKIEKLIPFIEKSTVTQVVFISSTSVYGNASGVITEDTQPQPVTASAREILLSEQSLLDNTNFKTTVIRFGGLIGTDRHPITFLSGKRDIKNPQGNINLIHQNDCIGIIKKVIEKNVWSTTINAVYPSHPTRKAYYTTKAKELSIAPPEFDETTSSTERIIKSNLIEQQLGYRFKFPV